MSLCCGCSLYQSLDMAAIRHTFSYCRQIFILAYLTPIYTPLERTLQHEVKPNVSATIITLHKRMGNIHFNIFVHYLIKSSFGHSFYNLQIHTILPPNNSNSRLGYRRLQTYEFTYHLIVYKYSKFSQST